MTSISGVTGRGSLSRPSSTCRRRGCDRHEACARDSDLVRNFSNSTIRCPRTWTSRRNAWRSAAGAFSARSLRSWRTSRFGSSPGLPLIVVATNLGVIPLQLEEILKGYVTIRTSRLELLPKIHYLLLQPSPLVADTLLQVLVLLAGILEIG